MYLLKFLRDMTIIGEKAYINQKDAADAKSLQEEMVWCVEKSIDNTNVKMGKIIMRIGEFLVKGKHITEDVLLEALALQKYNKNMLLGEILVRMEKLSKKDLDQHIEVYINTFKEPGIYEVSQWLCQDEVDKLRLLYLDTDAI